MLALSARAVPLSLAAAGVVMLAVSIRWARYDAIHPAEMVVFRSVNRLPSFLYPALWLPMQFGNLVVGLLAGLAAAAIMHDLAIAIAVVIATIAKLVVERVVRGRMKGFRDVRQRPGTSEPDAILRGD